jgi:3-hydroxyacyl-CoA dehydrogenase
MRLLEVVRGDKTAPDVLATCMNMARKIKKIAVVSGVCDGFIGNRMLAQYRAAANELMQQGALPQQIDGAIEAFGFAMGPFRVADLAGLDISWAGRKRRAAASPTPVAPIVDDWICEAGRFGQKTGAGWYRYEAGKREAIPDPIVEDMIAKYRAENGIHPRKIEDSEIIERCMFALVNEAARILEERIAARASDIDIVYLNGYGFPAHVGGPMHYANTVGLPKVLQRLKDFAAEPGANPKWQPAPLIVRLVERETGFN